MRKIISIKEEDFGKGGRYSGYVITLADGGAVKMGICNSQSCCEQWGYLTSQDDLSEFIGADLRSVSVVDAELQHYDVPEVYSGSTMFINVDTSAGLLQFVAYNEHNGYYSHEAVLIENDITTESEYL